MAQKKIKIETLKFVSWYWFAAVLYMKNVYCEKIHLVHFSPSQDDFSVTLSNILAKLHIFLTDVLLKSIKGKQKKTLTNHFL